MRSPASTTILTSDGMIEKDLFEQRKSPSLGTEGNRKRALKTMERPGKCRREVKQIPQPVNELNSTFNQALPDESGKSSDHQLNSDLSGGKPSFSMLPPFDLLKIVQKYEIDLRGIEPGLHAMEM